MNLLFYWKKSIFKNQYPNLKGSFFALSNHIKSINIGENLWVFAKHHDNYVLVGKFVADSKPILTNNTRYGKGDCYKIKYDNKLSKYFIDHTGLLAQDKQFELVLKQMNLTKKGKWNDEIALHFQGKAHVKEIDNIINSELEKYARKIKLY